MSSAAQTTGWDQYISSVREPNGWDKAGFSADTIGRTIEAKVKELLPGLPEAERQAMAPEEISMELSLPVRTVHECLDLLRESSMVTEVWNEEQERYVYQPATDINRMTLSFVLEKLESSGSLHKIVINNADYRKIDSALTKFESQIASSEANILLRDL